MSSFTPFLPEGLLAGLAAAGFNLLVALGLITVSLVLGIAISLLIGLPAVVTEPQRAMRAQLSRRVRE